MTKRTVTNCGNRTVSTDGTGDYAVATKPDELKIVKKNKTEKFNNWATSDQLIGGTSKSTTIAGCSIWTLPGKLGPPSHPTHGPGYLGTKNGMMPADGEAEAFTASTNLKAENHPVVRVKDETFQNRRNTTGEVMPELVLMDLSDAGGDEGGGSAFAKGAGGGVKKPSAGTRQQGTALLPPSGTAPVEACEVIEIAAACQHGRRAGGSVSSAGHMLQVVGTVWDRIRIEARVNGPCGRTHPVWAIESAEGVASPTGLQSFFNAKVPDQPLPCVRQGKQDSISKRPRNTYKIRCQGCRNNAHMITVQAFEPGLHQVVLERGKLWWGLVAINILAQVAGLEESELAPKPDPATPVVDGLSGKMIGSVQVVEHTDHRAFVETRLSLQFDPLLHLCLKVDLLGLVTDLAVTALTGVPATQIAGMRAARTGARRLKRSKDDIKALVDKKLLELESKINDFQDILSMAFGNEPDQGRQARARQMVKDMLAEMGQVALDFCPIQFPKMECESDINVKLAIDATLRSRGPDYDELVLSGAGITGWVKMKLAATSKARVGILVFRVPCEMVVKESADVGVTRSLYMDAYSFGIEKGTSPYEGFLEVHINCGSAKLVDIPPMTLKCELETPRVQIYPELEVQSS